MSHMISIGVRELRRDASKWLARVRAGEEVLVTDHGRPVARLSPVVERAGYETALQDGRIVPGTGKTMAEILDRLDAELPAGKGLSVSEALAALRNQEN